MNKNSWRYLKLITLLIMALVLMLPTSGEAGRARLNYFQTSKVVVDGREALRIELGLNRDKVDYQVTTSTLKPTELTLVMDDTKVRDLRNEITINSDIASHVTLTEIDDATKVVITANNKLTKEDYKVYTLERDRKQRKPYRLVIDIMAPAPDFTTTVKGVAGRTIVLDAGHGGSDSGAVGPTGYMEKTATLAVTKKVAAILKKSQANVIMTRTTDVDVYAPNDTAAEELQARCDVANRNPKTEVFVSIHCNAFSNSNAHGMETYYYAPSREGLRLASFLNEELEQAGGLFNRGVKTANFYVMKHTNMPASLIELAFITNPREESLLSDDSYQNKLAQAIAIGIARFFGKDKM